MSDKKQYQGGYADCYVLTDKRTTDWINKFLDKFVPNRKQTAEEFEVPQYSDNPIITFDNDEGLIDYLIRNKNTKHTLYWSNEDKSDLRGAMIFFTNDGHIIPGVYCETLENDNSVEDNYLNDLKTFWDSDKGHIAYEQPAPQSTDEFLRIVDSLN